MSDSTVVFFGYGPLGTAGIDALAAAGATPSLVVVPGNREGAAVDTVRAEAARLGVPTAVQPPRAAIAPFVERLRALSPDVIVVWSYSMLLPQAVLDVPRFGAVNLHGGLLPEYRGGHVLQWALINGERETGVTLHYMDAGADTGPVIADVRFPIGPSDDAVSVKAKLRRSGTVLLREWWPRLADGTAPRTPQDESRARLWPMRKPEDGRIDLTRSAAEICRLVRALADNDPGAYIDVGAIRLSVVRAAADPAPGSRGLLLPAAGGAVLVTEARASGRTLELSELQNLRDHLPHAQSAH